MLNYEIVLAEAEAEAAAVDRYTSQKMMSLGKDIYRQGILPNGEPI